MKRLEVAILAITLASCAGQTQSAAPSFGSFTPEPRTSAPPAPSASPSPLPLLGDAVAAAVRASGQPVADVVAFTAETDANQLLGRPGQYIAKVSWRDTRAATAPDLATIEVFADAATMQARFAYLDAIIKSSPLFLQWMYRNDTRLAILRLPKELTPDEAKSWEEWFKKDLKRGAGTTEHGAALSLASDVASDGIRHRPYSIPGPCSGCAFRRAGRLDYHHGSY